MGLLFSAWLAFHATPALALDPRLPLSHFSITTWSDADGLPHSTIQDVAQTPDGYLWLATLEGLARFDGVRFRWFSRANTALPRNDIQRAFVARDGTLWLGVFGGGLARLRDGAFEDLSSRLPADSVQDITQDASGNLWIATTRGLFRFDKDEKAVAFTTAHGLSHDFLERVLADPLGGVWAVTDRGLDQLKDERFVPVSATAGHRVRAVAWDPAGRLWVGTDHGVLALTPRGALQPGSRAVLDSEAVRKLLVDSRGLLWVGTSRGVLRVNADGSFEALTPMHGLPSGSVNAVREDNEGGVWIGTDVGLAQVKEGPIVVHARLQGLSEDIAFSVAPARRGGFWVGLENGRVDHVEGDRIRPLGSAPGGGPVLALFEDTSDRLWVGTTTGLYRHERRRWASLSGNGIPAAPVRSIQEDGAGRFWVGTDGEGLVRIERGKVAVLHSADGLPGDEVRAVLQSRGGTLWVATYGGLARIRDDRPEPGIPPGQPRLPLVRSLYEDGDGTLWIGTYGAGLARLRDGKLTVFTSRDGLWSDVIFGIAEDGAGRIWMSSNTGIFALRKGDLDSFAEGRSKRLTSEVFGRSDGMRSTECSGGFPSVFKDPRGRLWFPTTIGVVSLDPALSDRGRLLPPPVVDEVRIDGQPARGTTVTVPAGARRVEVDFRVPSLMSPDRARLSYRLDGFDPDWVETGADRSALYTGIPAGSYTLRLRATYGGDRFSESATALTFRVKEHWWRSGLFYASLPLAVFIGGVAAHRLRVRALVAHERALEARVQEAVASLKVLQGLLPICSGCKKIRDDGGGWKPLESYIHEHSEADFTHGLCPDCAQKYFPGRAKPAS